MTTRRKSSEFGVETCANERNRGALTPLAPPSHCDEAVPPLDEMLSRADEYRGEIAHPSTVHAKPAFEAEAAVRAEESGDRATRCSDAQATAVRGRSALHMKQIGSAPFINSNRRPVYTPLRLVQRCGHGVRLRTRPSPLKEDCSCPRTPSDSKR